MNIGEKLSKAIKEGKWLNISYINKAGENTFYWIAIKDIDFDSKRLFVSMFNDKISMKVYDAWIFFEKIKKAEVIEFSSFDSTDNLIDKIEKNLDKCQWLQYDRFNHNILNYYIECNIFDSDPSQKEYMPIEGIDLAKLMNCKRLALTEEQTKKIIADIYHYDIKNTSSTYYTLTINRLSIDEGKKKFVICYYNLTFDPIKMSLVLHKKLHFNQSFLEEGRRHSLFNYINMDMDEFAEIFETNYKEYIDTINNNLRFGERINTRPDIMLLQREVPTNLAETYYTVEEKYNQGILPIPLKSFFGNITKRNNIRRKEPSLIIYDKKININQMRVLYNALKYPVTYVQGPPGTGKTQTIINVVLSAFYNEKTTLICSSNNKPVDGIVEKLTFKYQGKTVNFPYLRLGKYDDVKNATLKIRDLYNFHTNQKPREDLLNKIKISNDDQNKKLIELLNIQERRVDIENCLESSQKLINSFKNNNSKIIDVIIQKTSQLRSDLDKLPEISNQQLVSLFVPLNENYQLSQFLYFKSLQYVEKLKQPRYADLIAICNIEDDDARVSEFNKWAQEDANMRKLTAVFPILFSTNISSRRLGTPKFMFDLVVMDEAGQCNIATALLPIAKAESLLLVGDPNQLKPVIILENQINEALKEKYNVVDKYDYKQNSILNVMIENDNISKYILLKYHYRCGKKIIDFSNQRYYNNKLNLSNIQYDGEIKVLDTKSLTAKQKNESFEEAQAIVNYIERNDIHDAYIITPFVNQKELIKSLLKSKNITDIDCGTIHSLQGAEKNTIFFSPAISLKTSEKTFAWIKNNYELINVAVTRAKNKLIIAADAEAIAIKSPEKNNDLYNLIQYAISNGKIEVPPNQSVKIEIGKSNGSANEDEFFKTVSHFCTCYKSFEAVRNVKLHKVIRALPRDMYNMEFDLVLYEKTLFSKRPIIAFEANGGEHLGSLDRERSDAKKMSICKSNKIKLIFIPNSFVKIYEYVADIILSCTNKTTSIQQSLFDE